MARKKARLGEEHAHEETYREFVCGIEEEELAALEELAEELTRQMGQKWTKEALVRVAVADLLSRYGKVR